MGQRPTMSILPGGPIDIRLHDAVGGHTIGRHVGKTDSWLCQRLITDPTISMASSFFDLVTAETAVTQVIQANLGPFYTWLSGGKRVEAFDYDTGIVVGTIASRDRHSGVITCSQGSTVRVVVNRLSNAYPPMFFVKTAFPVL